MRTCGSVFVAVNSTFAHAPQAFMCSMMRRRSSADALSRKPTVSRTPADPQYFWVITARLSRDGVNSRGSDAMLGALAGLISTADDADWRSLSGGTCLMVQPMYAIDVPCIRLDRWFDAMSARPLWN